MKRYQLLLGVIISINFLMSCIFAESKSILVIDKKVDVQTKDSLIYFGFEIQNSGTKTLAISSLGSSCDCTHLEIDSKEIGPDGRAMVKGTINTNYFDTKDSVSSTIMLRNNSDSPLVSKEFHFYLKMDSTYGFIER